jgi:adenosylcobinamide kinase/adenosylcobinamide-phosphate guanylyltransferase
MKILYFGGQKSGKSYLAEQKTLEIATNKPFYIATYDNSYGDLEMNDRIKKHKEQRADLFNSIEESKDLDKIIQKNQTYLIDCMSMWILNTIEEDDKVLFKILQKLQEIESDIVFVLNDVSSGIIPLDKMSRKYVDRSGIIGQKIASFCDEVYEVKVGLEIRLK